MDSLELAKWLEDFQLIITICLLPVLYLSHSFDYISDFSILYSAKKFISWAHCYLSLEKICT